MVLTNTAIDEKAFLTFNGKAFISNTELVYSNSVSLSLSYESNRDQMDQIDVCKIGLAVGTKLSNAGSISLGTAEWEDNSTK